MLSSNPMSAQSNLDGTQQALTSMLVELVHSLRSIEGLESGIGRVGASKHVLHQPILGRLLIFADPLRLFLFAGDKSHSVDLNSANLFRRTTEEL